MDIYDFLGLFGGLAFFLYGMGVMSDSLERLAGGSLQQTMQKVTSKKILSLLLGIIITVIIQSSSGTLVMLVGLVNSGIINFYDTLPIILGANIGSTITGWILTLTGISTDSFTIMSVFSPEFFSPVLAFVGIILKMTGKTDKKKDLGTILIGFSILMYGMEFMSGAFKDVAGEPWFADMLTMFSNPLLAFLVSAVFTGIIQSSGATIGILEALSLSGMMNFYMAIPLILGANVGTCITAMISSIGTNRRARRVSVLQLLVNTINGLVVLIIVMVSSGMFSSLFEKPVNHVSIAMVHTLFNVFVTVMGMLFSKQLYDMARSIVKEDSSDLPVILIDERLITRPTIAVDVCMSETVKMAQMAEEVIRSASSLLRKFDEKKYQEIVSLEDKLDWYQDQLDSFLIKLSRTQLSKADSETVNKMLHVITDFERIGDHSLNISQAARHISEGNMSFSEEAMNELDVLMRSTEEIMGFAARSFEENDLASAAQVEPLEEVIDALTARIRDNHIIRLQEGRCSIELGIILTELLNNYERVSDHCSNVAVCLIELSDDEFYTHSYLNNLKHESEAFKALYGFYYDKYITGKGE